MLSHHSLDILLDIWAMCCSSVIPKGGGLKNSGFAYIYMCKYNVQFWTRAVCVTQARRSQRLVWREQDGSEMRIVGETSQQDSETMKTLSRPCKNMPQPKRQSQYNGVSPCGSAKDTPLFDNVDLRMSCNLSSFWESSCLLPTSQFVGSGSNEVMSAFSSRNYSPPWLLCNNVSRSS